MQECLTISNYKTLFWMVIQLVGGYIGTYLKVGYSRTTFDVWVLFSTCFLNKKLTWFSI